MSENTYEIIVEKSKVKRPLGREVIDGRIILKRIQTYLIEIKV
jgi:hypothetical protein